MLNILVACEYNSGRSQIACTYLNHFGGEYLVAECAGLDPKPINPLVILAMREVGYRIEGINSSYSIQELIDLKRKFDFIISVCSKESDHLFPTFPDPCRKINWPHCNPAHIPGGRLERLQAIRDMRDGIRSDAITFIEDLQQSKGFSFSIPKPPSTVSF